MDNESQCLVRDKKYRGCGYVSKTTMEEVPLACAAPEEPLGIREEPSQDLCTHLTHQHARDQQALWLLDSSGRRHFSCILKQIENWIYSLLGCEIMKTCAEDQYMTRWEEYGSLCWKRVIKKLPIHKYLHWVLLWSIDTYFIKPLKKKVFRVELAAHIQLVTALPVFLFFFFCFLFKTKVLGIIVYIDLWTGKTLDLKPISRNESFWSTHTENHDNSGTKEP